MISHESWMFYRQHFEIFIFWCFKSFPSVSSYLEESSTALMAQQFYLVLPGYQAEEVVRVCWLWKLWIFDPTGLILYSCFFGFGATHTYMWCFNIVSIALCSVTQGNHEKHKLARKVGANVSMHAWTIWIYDNICYICYIIYKYIIYCMYIDCIIKVFLSMCFLFSSGQPVTPQMQQSSHIYIRIYIYMYPYIYIYVSIHIYIYVCTYTCEKWHDHYHKLLPALKFGG